MDNEMIERATEATYNKYNQNLIPSLEPHWKDLPENFKFRLREAVKDGIKAMREPTEKMLEPVTNVDGFFKLSDPKQGWQTMIDAIIGDE